MVPVSYYDMINAPDHTYSTRMAMVLHAQTHGIRATVRAMGCSRNTVRLWLRRFRAEGRQGLHPKSCAPKTCPPHKTHPSGSGLIPASFSCRPPANGGVRGACRARFYSG